MKVSIVLFSYILSLVHGYSIHQSCYNYWHGDKSNMVIEALHEQYTIANLGVAHITAPPDQLDDTKDQLFRGANNALLRSIQARYNALVLHFPWTLTYYQHPVSNQVTFYCGDEMFIPNVAGGGRQRGDIWYDTTTGYVWEGFDHNQGRATHGFCIEDIQAHTLEYRQLQNPQGFPGEENMAIIILCQSALVQGPAIGSQGSVSTFAALYAAGRIQYGMRLPQLAHQMVLSELTTHESFHAIIPDEGKFLPI